MADRDFPVSRDDGLFRREAVEERQSQWLGSVLLVPRISHGLFAAFAVLAIAGFLALLFLANVPRKARIEGWLVPREGAARVFAPQPGTVTRLYVAEGMRVKKGAPLALVSADVESRTAGRLQLETINQLTRRRESLASDGSRQRRLADQEAQALSARISVLRSEQASLTREIALQRERIAIAVKGVERLNQLRGQGYVTAKQFEEAEENRLQESARLETLQRTRSAGERDALALAAELHALPLRTQGQIALIGRDVAALDQEVIQAEAQREFVISAPQDGVVTAVQPSPGETVGTSTPLLIIVPAGATLEAQLFSSSRAIGFVTPGQTVRMRYDAYPYQKFGLHEGRVVSVSRLAINPSDLSQFPSSLVGRSAPSEPVYRIIVRPRSQTVVAYGRRMPLQPGMQLDADILLEKRRLIDWVLEPLYTLSGR